MTNLSIKNIKNNYIVGSQRGSIQSSSAALRGQEGATTGPKGFIKKGITSKGQSIGQKLIEIDKVGTKNSKKVSIPSKGKILTEFQNRFKAKQTIKKYYGSLSEKTWKNLINSQNNMDQLDNNSIICELEKRLDVILFRLGMASSILEARFLIKGGLIKINDKVVHSKSYSKSINIGSKISVDISNLSYLAKIKHLKFNLGLSKVPTHLMWSSNSPSGALAELANPTGVLKNASLPTKGGASLGFRGSFAAKRPIGGSGYILYNPIESEVLLPYNFPINKIK